ncbi:hypothetical protein GCM10010363_46790 [Streptomyces omiyaensis]|nr:hypothetical protein GCM10010363_46790 [Streptomyces omiyaensis]
MVGPSTGPARCEGSRTALSEEAATDILVDEGAAAVTPAAVGARACLARSSVYRYFDSSPALLSTLTEEVFRRSGEALTRAVSSSGAGSSGFVPCPWGARGVIAVQRHDDRPVRSPGGRFGVGVGR